jgi:hypothetical protein
MKILTFPLCLLSYQDTIEQRLQHIICYCILANKRSTKQANIKDILQKITPAQDFNFDDETHQAVMKNAYELGINFISMERTIARGRDAAGFVKRYEQQYGRDSWTQVNIKVVLDTLNNQFPYNDFAILCAVSSSLGKQDGKFKQITGEQIGCRMNGFKSKKILDAEVVRRDVKIIDISYRQLLRRVDAVSRMGYFSKYTYHKRDTYYSSYLKREQIMKAVYNRKSYAKRKEAEFRVIENELEQELKNVSNAAQEENASLPHEIVL